MNSQSTHVLFDYFEDLADAHELELILQRPPEEVRAELLADGADLERVRMALAHAMGEGEPPPARAPRTLPPPTNVVPIARARPGRVLTVLRTISVAVAASFFGLFVWKQGTMHVGTERPGRSELSQATPVPPPPSAAGMDLQKAEQLRAEARRLCAEGHWGPCEDRLDEAGRLDRAGDDTLAVHELRNQIGPGMDEDGNNGASMYAKPAVGPGEVPLRRRPH